MTEDEKRSLYANRFMIISIIIMLICFYIHDYRLNKMPDEFDLKVGQYNNYTKHNYSDNELFILDIEEFGDHYFANLSISNSKIKRIKTLMLENKITYDITYDGIAEAFKNNKKQFNIISKECLGIANDFENHLEELDINNEYILRLFISDPDNPDLVYITIENGEIDTNIVDYKENNTYGIEIFQ